MGGPARDPREFFAANYWSFLAARSRYMEQPQPAIRYWWNPTGFCDVDRLIFRELESHRAVIDVGAGDLLHKRKFQAAGLRADYATMDPTVEIAHDFHDLSEIPSGSYDAALLLEVLEHIPLAESFTFLDGVVRALEPASTLIISTPNADFISSIWAADFTHVHAYRAVDLAALLEVVWGFRSRLYRVAWRAPRAGLREYLRFHAARFLTRGILQTDYARGILLVAKREASESGADHVESPPSIDEMLPTAGV